MAKRRAARAARRERQRAAQKLAERRERLFASSAGGSPGRAIEVSSASVVEPHAESLPCPRCDGALAVLEHAAHTVDGVRLRAASVRCRSCGSSRTIWFRLPHAILH